MVALGGLGDDKETEMSQNSIKLVMSCSISGLNMAHMAMSADDNHIRIVIVILSLLLSICSHCE